MENKNYREELENWQALVKGRPLVFDEQEQILKKVVNRLIESLYKPDSEVGWKCSTFLFKDELINWGDLSCRNVAALKNGEFVVYIEEADPSCYEFSQWVESWLEKWGWKADVKTEW